MPKSVSTLVSQCRCSHLAHRHALSLNTFHVLLFAHSADASYVGTSSIATAGEFALGVLCGTPSPDADDTSPLLSGIGSLLYVPLSNVYGRRPVLLFAQGLAVVAGFGSAFAKTFGTLIIGRSFVGLGGAAGNVLSVLLISDIFCCG